MKKYPESKNTFVTEDGRFFKNGRELKQQVDIHGYKAISLQFIDGTWKNVLAHRIVAKTYISNPENKPCVNHKNGIKHDNRVCNLEWNTYSENTQHAFDTGLQISAKGEEVWNARLTDHEVHLVCKDIQEGRRNKEIAEKFQVPRYIIKNIRYGGSWLHISSQYTLLKPKRENRISEETVRWICRLLEDGLRDMEVVEKSSSKAVTKSLVNKIKRRICFKDIVCDYKF